MEEQIILITWFNVLMYITWNLLHVGTITILPVLILAFICWGVIGYHVIMAFGVCLHCEGRPGMIRRIDGLIVLRKLTFRSYEDLKQLYTIENDDELFAILN